MIVEKFKTYNQTNKPDMSLIDNIQILMNSIDKGFKFKFGTSNVFCFGKDDISILIFEQDSHPNIQKMFDKSNKIKNLGGYNFFKINRKLENPFFNNGNQYLESYFYFNDKNSFKKVKYFISKILSISEEMEYFPAINWDSNKIVSIKISPKNNILGDNDFLLANKITEIWNNLQ